MSDQSTETPTGWEGILAEDETILWQGRPHTGIRWGDLMHVQLFMGLFFCIFSALWTRGVFWMAGSMPRDMTGGMIWIFPLFGALFFAVGLYMVVGRLFWDAYVRGRTWYTLTNQAAYIATNLFNKRDLKRYSHANMQDPVLTDTQPGDVIFAREQRQYTSRNRRRNPGDFSTTRVHTYYVPIGFRGIDDPRRVYHLLVTHRPRPATD